MTAPSGFWLLPYNIVMPDSKRIAVLGAGNIGAALIGGILKGGVADREHLIATVRTAERAEELAARYVSRPAATARPPRQAT